MRNRAGNIRIGRLIELLTARHPNHRPPLPQTTRRPLRHLRLNTRARPNQSEQPIYMNNAFARVLSNRPITHHLEPCRPTLSKNRESEGEKLYEDGKTLL